MAHLRISVFCLCFITVYSNMAKVEYVVNNQLMKPNFHQRIEISVPEGTPFIRVMETAADRNPAFNFTGRYYSKMGYLITEINGLTSKYYQDGSYWEIYNASNVYTEGVSSYKPSDGDVVTFNFTDEDHSLERGLSLPSADKKH